MSFHSAVCSSSSNKIKPLEAHTLPVAVVLISAAATIAVLVAEVELVVTTLVVVVPVLVL